MIAERTYEYSLDPGSKKFLCPSCGQRRFVRFINLKTREYLSEEFGRCDREQSCGYFNVPKMASRSFAAAISVIKQEKTDYIDQDKVRASLRCYEKNPFVQFLRSRYGDQAESVIRQYMLGTSKQWGGSVIFWQVDTQGYVRTGKIMGYDPLTGKRIQEPFNQVKWVHPHGYSLRQCFFGEHLLKQKGTVCIVESEKTAVICAIHRPEYIWLASGSLHGINPEKMQALKGRKVILFPDVGCYAEWKKKAERYGATCNPYLESIAGNQYLGYDLADFYLASLDRIEPKNYIQSLYREGDLILNGYGYPCSWDVHSPTMDEKTRKIISMINRNDSLLYAVKKLDLE